jgi:hypothetical protein
MEGEIVNSGKNEPESQVDLGDGSLVSMKTVQRIYNEITGRTEALSRSYRINHIVDFEDLVQLNVKICQLYEQYNIVSSTSAVTVYYHDDQKQEFSSFSRFNIYDRSTLSPVENVRLEYKFLIVLPNTQKPQSYELEINVHSRAAIMQRAKREVDPPEGMFIEVVTDRTAYFEIKYVDYTVARNFEMAVDGWFKGLKQLPDHVWVRRIRWIREYFSVGTRVLTVLAYLYACCSVFVPVLNVSSVPIGDLYRIGVLTFGGASILGVVAGRIGSSLSVGVRRIRPVSGVNLTKGDARAIEQAKAENKAGLFRAAVSAALAVALNVFSSWLAIRLGLCG